MLKKFPNNKNNAEIYRILGEKAYADGNYPKALDNLKKYEKTTAQVLRADMYYLGVSCLKTDKAQDAVKYLSKVTTGDDEMSEKFEPKKLDIHKPAQDQVSQILRLTSVR